jgi:3-methyladenine DNA glycosylase AlkC
MPEKLTDIFFGDSFIRKLAGSIAEVYPPFDAERFLALVYGETWEGLALKARMHHVTQALHQTLPHDFPQALQMLKSVAPSFHGFDSMVFPDYVASYGLDHWELSMPALALFTPLCSSEYAVRPFIAQDPQRAMAYLSAWAQDENEHLRRLASEGSRPRLPWGMALECFKADPTPLLPILEVLKDDPSEYVRKSVANNLNDISKDHPEWVLDLCEAWYGHSPRTDWIVKHACRGLLKKGNRRAMRLFGFAEPADIHVEELTLQRTALAIGEELAYAFDLRVAGQERCKVRLELRVDYARGGGKTSRKVFQLGEAHYPPGTHRVERRLSLVDRSVRKHHPGQHRLVVVVNGVEKAEAHFDLLQRT